MPVFSCFGFPCGGGGPRQCGRGSDIKANLEWVLTDCAAHPEARCVMQRSLSGGFLTEDAALLDANVMVVAAAGNSASDPCTNYYDSDATFNIVTRRDESIPSFTPTHDERFLLANSAGVSGQG